MGEHSRVSRVSKWPGACARPRFYEMNTRVALAALALIAIVGANEYDDPVAEVVEDTARTEFIEETPPAEMYAARMKVTTNNYIWKDAQAGICGCKQEFIPVCAAGRDFHSPCAAKCKNHKKYTHGTCKTKKAKKTPMPKKAPKKRLSTKCKKNLARMKKWAHHNIAKAHAAAKQARRYESHAAFYKSKCDEHMAGIRMSRIHAQYNYCALHDKFKAKAAKIHKEGAEHAHKAEIYHHRFKKKACFKLHVDNHTFIGHKKWGGLGKRISLIWSKDFIKKYSMRWPHCYNLQCFPRVPRTIIEKACMDHDDCTGFSFTADQRMGSGCIKNCFQRDNFKGYGFITNDYWKKRELSAVQISASKRAPVLYGQCFHNGENTLAWSGPSRVVRTPKVKSMPKVGLRNKSLSGASIPKGWCVRLYEKQNFKGRSFTLVGPKNVDCLQKYRMQGRISWDNKVQSMKVYHNDYCSFKKRKVKKPKFRDNFHELPSEHAWYWDNAKNVDKALGIKKKKLKKSAIRAAVWRKKQIAKSLRKLRHLHEKALVHSMSKAGMKGPQSHDAYAKSKYAKSAKKKKKAEMMADEEDKEDKDMENILNGKKESKKAAEPKKSAEPATDMNMSNYMNLILRKIFNKQPKRIQEQFKKPEEWCLHFHAECRAALHDRLLAHNKVIDHATMPEPVSRYTESLGLLTSPKIEIED